MIGQYLPQTNETAIVAKSKKNSHLNKTIVCSRNSIRQRYYIVVMFLMCLEAINYRYSYSGIYFFKSLLQYSHYYSITVVQN